jgi:hypothetical protein
VKNPWHLRHYLHGTSPGFVYRQLLSPEHRLVLGFTPKAACTVGAKLFFSHIGELDQALAFHPWIHKYRWQYTKSHAVIPSRHWTAEFTKIKLVRNPFDRAVSGYTHAMFSRLLDRDLARFFRRQDKHELSFCDYLDFVEARIDKGLNAHFGRQLLAQEVDQYPYDFILKIEQFQIGLAEIERRFGLRFDLNETILGSHHHRRKLPMPESDLSAIPFRELVPDAERVRAVPPHDAFYNPAVRQRVAGLFRTDFDAYGYSDLAGTIRR